MAAWWRKRAVQSCQNAEDSFRNEKQDGNYAVRTGSKIAMFNMFTMVRMRTLRHCSSSAMQQDNNNSAYLTSVGMCRSKQALYDAGHRVVASNTIKSPSRCFLLLEFTSI